ncbi:unnamed protein product [Lactuca saligna]|uniref:Uncharacterized protein n=1 Tax=Lactuca saligna TaxID=75948 RepID=A0AA35ZCB9_LACSI|nr:unnamed protein product [Lactuca saligna]
MRDPISSSSFFIRSRRHQATEKASWLVLICSSLLPYSVDTVGVVLMEGVPPDLEPDDVIMKKERGKMSGVNLVDSLLDAGCDAISIENKGLGLSNGSEGVVMGSKISSKVVMADIASSPMVNHVIRNPIKEEGVT